MYTQLKVMNAKLAAERKEKVQQVEELIGCRVCDKKHKKRSSGYKCNHCGMMGKVSTCVLSIYRLANY